MEDKQLSFQDIYKRINKITDTPSVNLMHLMEEAGELSTEVMIESNLIKKTSNEGILGEAADCVVCSLALMANKTGSWATALAMIDKKLRKWENNIDSKNSN